MDISMLLISRKKEITKDLNKKNPYEKQNKRLAKHTLKLFYIHLSYQLSYSSSSVHQPMFYKCMTELGKEWTRSDWGKGWQYCG